jgi:hypothetical protein
LGPKVGQLGGRKSIAKRIFAATPGYGNCDNVQDAEAEVISSEIKIEG